MNTPVILETYRDTEIAFRKDGWVNAAQMGAAYGKIPQGFLSSTWGKRYAEALRRDVAKIVDGVWFHPDLAMEFGGWLERPFRLWIAEKIVRAQGHIVTEESRARAAAFAGVTDAMKMAALSQKLNASSTHTS